MAEGGGSAVTLRASHRSVLRLALALLPIIFVAEWFLEAIDSDDRFLPRWYVYLPFALAAYGLLRLRRPNALGLLMPAVAYLAVGTVFESIWEVDTGVPDSSTTLGLLVGLGILSAVIAYDQFVLAVMSTTAAVAVVAVVTGADARLPGDDQVIRVSTSVLMVSLSAWMIWRLRSDLDSKAADLEQVAQTRERLVAAVSHELRTPLTGIVGFSDELANHWDQFDRAEGQQLVGVIAEQAHDMADIIEDLLVAARVDGGDIALQPADVILRAEVERVLGTGLVAGWVSEGRVQLAGNDVTAWADPLRFRQIVRNLVTNAARYGQGTITVTISAPSADVAAVSVADEGSPLAPETAERVFEPYFTAHSDNRTEGAVGLGLPVSRQLAQLMGGDLRYQPAAELNTFVLTLPRTGPTGPR